MEFCMFKTLDFYINERKKRIYLYSCNDFMELANFTFNGGFSGAIVVNIQARNSVLTSIYLPLSQTPSGGLRLFARQLTRMKKIKA